MKIGKKPYIVTLLVVYATSFIVEILAAFAPSFFPLGKIGTILWYNSFVFLLLYVVQCLSLMIKEVLKGGFLLSFITILIFVCILFVNLSAPKSISFETTQEIGCTLHHFAYSLDWGYHQACLFGYPARQFFIPALPSLLFGRHQWSLNVGGSFYFLLGLVIFAAGTYHLFKDKRKADLIIAILLASILHIYYFNHFMFVFEQSIFPFSFGLIGVGLFLAYVQDKNLEALILIGFVLDYLIFSYTPSLALFFLFYVGLQIYLFMHSPSNWHKNILMGIVLLSLITFLLSLPIRHDINILSQSSTHAQLQNDLREGLNHLLFQNNGNPLASQFLHAVLILFLVLSLTFFFGWEMFLVALWILGVVAFAVVSKGYTYYGIDFRFHRATIIFPVLFGAIAYILRRYSFELKKAYMIFFAVYLIVLISGMAFAQSILNARYYSRNIALMKWLETKGMSSAKISRQFYFDLGSNSQIQGENYGSFHDYTMYFVPSWESTITDQDCSQLTKPLNGLTYLLVAPNKQKNSLCMKQDYNYTQKGIFTFPGDQSLMFYEVQSK